MKIFNPLLALAALLSVQIIQAAHLVYGTINNSGELNNFISETITKADQGTLRLGRFTKSMLNEILKESIQPVNTTHSISVFTYYVYNDINRSTDRNSLDWDKIIENSFAKFQGLYPVRAERALRRVVFPIYPILKNTPISNMMVHAIGGRLDNMAIEKFHWNLERLINLQEDNDPLYEQQYQELIIDATYSTTTYSELRYHSFFLRKLNLRNLVRTAIPPINETHTNLARYLTNLAIAQFNANDRQVTDKILISISPLVYDRIADYSAYHQFITECLNFERDYEHEHHVQNTMRILGQKLQELNGDRSENAQNLGEIIRFIFAICEHPKYKGIINLNGRYFDWIDEDWSDGCLRSFAYMIMCTFKGLYPTEALKYTQTAGVEYSFGYFLFNQPIHDLNFLKKLIRHGHVGTFMDITEDQETVPGELIEVVFITASISAAIIIREKSNYPITVNEDFKECIMQSATWGGHRVAQFLLNLVPRDDVELQSVVQSSLIEAIGEEQLAFVLMIFNERFEIKDDFIRTILSTILENYVTDAALPFFNRFPRLDDSILDGILNNQEDYYVSSVIQIALAKPDLSDEWLKKAIGTITDNAAIDVIRRQRPDLFDRIQRSRT